MSVTDGLSIKELQSLRTSAKDNLNKIEAEIKRQEDADRSRRLDPLKPLVIRAHDLLCGWNHTDGCGWCYEIKDGQHCWEGDYSAHGRWLRHYETLIHGKPANARGVPTSIEEVEATLDAIEGLRKKFPSSTFLIRIGALTP